MRLSPEVPASLLQACYLALIRPISGCVNIACSGLMITSLPQVVNRFDASCFNNLQQVCKYQVASSLISTDSTQLNEANGLIQDDELAPAGKIHSLIAQFCSENCSAMMYMNF